MGPPIYFVVKSLFNVLMVMSARDRPSAAERDFICNNHSNCQYAGADCDPTSSQNITRIDVGPMCRLLVLHEFESSFR